MGIERLACQQIADRRHADVDHEHDRDQEGRQVHRIGEGVIQSPIDDAGEVARHDGKHEGEEEALYRPGARVIGDLGHVWSSRRSPDHPLAKGVSRVTGLHQPPVEPCYVGNGQQQEPWRGVHEQVHGVAVVAAPIPAREAVEDGDGKPRCPQPCGLHKADVEHRTQPPGRRLPIDPGRGVAMNLVHQQ